MLTKANRKAARDRGICPCHSLTASTTLAKALNSSLRLLYKARARIEQTMGKLKRWLALRIRALT